MPAGRPPISEIIRDKALAVAEAMLQYDASFDQIELEFARQTPPIQMSFCTLKRIIKDKYDCNFEQLREKRRESVRLKLRQKAIKMSLDGNATMLIFCLKNLCGWSDKVEPQDDYDEAYTPRQSLEIPVEN